MPKADPVKIEKREVLHDIFGDIEQMKRRIISRKNNITNLNRDIKEEQRKLSNLKDDLRKMEERLSGAINQVPRFVPTEEQAEIMRQSGYFRDIPTKINEVNVSAIHYRFYHRDKRRKEGDQWTEYCSCQNKLKNWKQVLNYMVDRKLDPSDGPG